MGHTVARCKNPPAEGDGGFDNGGFDNADASGGGGFDNDTPVVESADAEGDWETAPAANSGGW